MTDRRFDKTLELPEGATVSVYLDGDDLYLEQGHGSVDPVVIPGDRLQEFAALVREAADLASIQQHRRAFWLPGKPDAR